MTLPKQPFSMSVRRFKIRPTMKCARRACGRILSDEFIEDDLGQVFDGVLNDKGQPFHHGCENF